MNFFNVHILPSMEANSIIIQLKFTLFSAEGDLKQFSQLSEYHEAKHGYDAHIFLPTNRPQCIQDQYALSMRNPVKVIRAADLYRRDGLSGSKYFKCWPVVLNQQTIRTPDLNLPRRVCILHMLRKINRIFGL